MYAVCCILTTYLLTEIDWGQGVEGEEEKEEEGGWE